MLKRIFHLNFEYRVVISLRIDKVHLSLQPILIFSELVMIIYYIFVQFVYNPINMKNVQQTF